MAMYTRRDIKRLKSFCTEEIHYANLFQDEHRLCIAHLVFDFILIAEKCEDIIELVAPFIEEALSLWPWETMHNRLSIEQNSVLVFREIQAHLPTEREAPWRPSSTGHCPAHRARPARA